MFEERQRFRQKWLWIAMAATLVGPVLLAIEAVHRSELWAAVAATGTLTLGLWWFFFSLELRVIVDDAGVTIRFWPLTTRRIPRVEIQRAEAQTYHPLREFGGWGVRRGLHRQAYTVSGDRGVELTLADGKRILVGSYRCDELVAAIRPR